MTASRARRLRGGVELVGMVGMVGIVGGMVGGIVVMGCSQSPSSGTTNKQQAAQTTEAETTLKTANDSSLPKADSCQQAMKKLEAFDFGDWNGLPPSCTRHELVKRFASLGPGGQFVLGARQRTAAFELLTMGTHPSPIKMWNVDERVVMLEIENPKLAHDLATLERTIGKPDGVLEFAWDVLTLKGEWVWPTRGLTLFVNPDNRAILRVAVYAPTTLEAYRETLQINRAVHEFAE